MRHTRESQHCLQFGCRSIHVPQHSFVALLTCCTTDRQESAHAHSSTDSSQNVARHVRSLVFVQLVFAVSPRNPRRIQRPCAYIQDINKDDERLYLATHGIVPRVCCTILQTTPSCGETPLKDLLLRHVPVFFHFLFYHRRVGESISHTESSRPQRRCQPVHRG